MDKLIEYKQADPHTGDPRSVLIFLCVRSSPSYLPAASRTTNPLHRGNMHGVYSSLTHSGIIPPSDKKNHQSSKS